jgi:hypothetical protein
MNCPFCKVETERRIVANGGDILGDFVMCSSCATVYSERTGHIYEFRGPRPAAMETRAESLLERIEKAEKDIIELKKAIAELDNRTTGQIHFGMNPYTGE